MNNTEAVKLCRLVKGLCPTQPIDEITPDAWAIVMDDIRFTDAQQAVRHIYRNHGNDQEFGGRKIEADDIIREVGRIRTRRINDHPPIDPPPGLTVPEYITWQKATRQRIADGETITNPALTQRYDAAEQAIRPAVPQVSRGTS